MYNITRASPWPTLIVIAITIQTERATTIKSVDWRTSLKLMEPLRSLTVEKCLQIITQQITFKRQQYSVHQVIAVPTATTKMSFWATPSHRCTFSSFYTWPVAIQNLVLN